MTTIDRREFLAKTGLILASTSAALADSHTDKAMRPNLLIIQTDEHNFRTLGCYRKTLSPKQAFMWGPDAVVETPNIDWIAENGALCTKFYATSPVCAPSRATLMSSLYPQNTGVEKNDVPMNDDVVTFAQILQNHGYATGYAGKWHLDGEGKPQWAPERKFGFEDNRYMYNRGHWKQLEDTPQGPRVKTRNKKGPIYNVHGTDQKSFTTDFLTDKTVDFINAHKSEPFCYMVSLPDPHGPDAVRPPYDTMYRGLKFEKPRTFDKPEENLPRWARKQKNGRRVNQSQYFGMVKCIDDNVGKILACLRQNNLLDNTIVVFTSDHGDLRAEHHRQNKGVPLEASAKIPFLIYYPTKIKPGTVINQALGTVDFLPTILSLMEIAPDAPKEGRDVAPLLTTGKAPTIWKDVIFLRGAGKGENWLAAFTNRYKLIISPVDEPWLIDMQEDPDELTNFLGNPNYRDTIQILAKELQSYMKKFRDPRIKNKKIVADLKRCATI